MGVTIRDRVFKKLFLATLFLAYVPFLASAQPNAWINEFHYDNAGDDTGEFIEIVIENSKDYTLSDFQVDIYNGSDTEIQDTETLDNIIEGNSNGNYTFYTWYPSSIQNGPEAIALSHKGTLISGQFLSYGGTFTGTGGAADGVTSTDIGVSEPGDVGESLQLTGTGLNYNDFSWQSPSNDSPGSLNNGQFLHPTIQLTASSSSVDEDVGSVTITASINKPDGKEVNVDIAFQTSSSSAVSEDLSGAVTQNLTFSSSASDGNAQSASFTIVDDKDFEGSETAIFKLTDLSTSGSAQLGSPTIYELTIIDNDKPDVVINEINADPGNDANGNSTIDSNDDEFVEIVNNEAVSVNVSGWTISDEEVERFSFDSNTILEPHSAAVAFGSTDFSGSFGGSIVQGTSSLSLNNNGDDVILKDDNGTIIDSYTYGSEGANDESLVRDSDGAGAFIGHTNATGSGGAVASPGTKIDGTNFANTVTIEGAAGWRMLSSPKNNMSIDELTDDTPIQGYPGNNSSYPANFYVGYDGTDFVKATNIGEYTFANGRGFILYFFNNDQAGSSDLPVTLDPPSGQEHVSDVTGISLHSSGDGWNLLGNPFETAIDISDINSWVNGGSLVNNVGQVWDNKSQSWVTTTTNGNKVEAWQGFFIQNTDAESIDFPLSAKTSGSNFYKESIGNKGYMNFVLRGEHASEDIQTMDEAAVLYFHTNASHDWDVYDASKLIPLNELMSSKQYHALIGFPASPHPVTGATFKAQESRPFEFEGELSFNMQLQTENMHGNFDLSWGKHNLPENWRFTLVDNYTGTQVDMDAEKSYKFTIAPGQKANSLAPEEREVERSLLKIASVKSKNGSESRFTLKVSAPGSRSASKEIPETVKLNQNYPNPFNPSTTISFELKEQAQVELNVYTIVGQKVATLVDEVRDAGSHDETWNAADLPSGIYIAQLEVQGKVFIRKMTLIK